MPLKRFEHLNSLPVHVAVLDAEGTIVSVNGAWKAFVRASGLVDADYGVGSNYLLATKARDVSHTRELAGELLRLLDGEIGLLTFAYPFHAPEAEHWFVLIGVPIRTPSLSGAAVLHIDISDVIRGPATVRNLGLTQPVGEQAGETVSPISREEILAELGISLERILPEFVYAPVRVAAGPSPSADGQEREIDTQWVREVLTPRQREVLALLGEGKTHAEIARHLSTSPHTVKQHVSAILKRLKLQSRTQAAALAGRIATGDGKA